MSDDRLGLALKRRRQEAGISMADLARATGLSRTFLTNVERGLNSPTISSLRAIVDALGVTLSSLFASIERQGGVVTRPADRLLIASLGGGAITYELLNPHPAGALEMLLLRVAPGASSGEATHRHAGEEVGLMMEGRLEYWIDGVMHALEAGDSVNVPATTPHRYHNPGPGPSVSLWVVTPPSF